MSPTSYRLLERLQKDGAYAAHMLSRIHREGARRTIGLKPLDPNCSDASASPNMRSVTSANPMITHATRTIMTGNDAAITCASRLASTAPGTDQCNPRQDG